LINGDVEMEQEMITLYQTITASLPDLEHRTVLLIGSRSNEGTSTVARQLARTVSLRIEKDVLLIDLDRSRPDLHIYSGLKHESSAGDSCREIKEPLCQVEETKLFVMPLFKQTVATPKTLESAKSSGFWDPLKNRFDLIIVDSPPASAFPDGLGIVSRVDGVILVTEAEKTRWQAALRTKEQIISHGGRVLGTVFNKRRYYIPQFIYNHL
jgi:Mrp family chromosome partitioning ATPase